MSKFDRRAFVHAIAALGASAAVARASAAEEAGWGTLSKAERDAAYNNSAAVAGSADIVAKWDAASEAWRKSHPGHLALPYAPKERTKWDLFPASDASKPCLILIHGGFWQTRSKGTFSCLSEGLRAYGGYVGISVL